MDFRIFSRVLESNRLQVVTVAPDPSLARLMPATNNKSPVKNNIHDKTEINGEVTDNYLMDRSGTTLERPLLDDLNQYNLNHVMSRSLVVTPKWWHSRLETRSVGIRSPSLSVHNSQNSQQKLIENSKDQVQIKQNISASDRLQTNVKSKEDANSELTIIKQITGK